MAKKFEPGDRVMVKGDGMDVPAVVTGIDSESGTYKVMFQSKEVKRDGQKLQFEGAHGYAPKHAMRHA